VQSGPLDFESGIRRHKSKVEIHLLRPRKKATQKSHLKTITIPALQLSTELSFPLGELLSGAQAPSPRAVAWYW